MQTFPPDFVNSLDYVPACDKTLLLDSLAQPSPTSIRVNPKKYAAPLPHERIPWTTDGYYLDQRPTFTLDPLLHAGVYYVQEAASMLIQHVFSSLLSRSSGIRVLDACAAPGGKSTLLSSLLDETSLLVCNEMNRLRASILLENITKWGNPNTMVTCSHTQQYGELDNFFDLVVIDAPCSGEGMFRKLDHAQHEWSMQNVELCAARQKEVVGNLWETLKPGGYMIYSTCTFNRHENEDVAQWAVDSLGAECIPVDIDPDWGIIRNTEAGITTFRCFPGSCRGEGFTLFVLQKDSDTSRSRKHWTSRNKPLLHELKNKDTANFYQYITQRDYIFASDVNNDIHAIHQSLFPDVINISNHVKTIGSGCLIGQVKGKDFIPNPSLALSSIFNHLSTTQVEVDGEKCLRYYAKSAFTLDGTPDGWTLLTHRGHGIGIVKKIANRVNNNYPNEWRIKMNIEGKNITRVL